MPFVHYTRYYLDLPQILKPYCSTTVTSSEHDPGARRSTCMAGHEDTTTLVLWVDCSHLISCPGSYAARHAAHERVNKVFVTFAREAGADATTNPSTAAMMGSSLSSEQAHILYPVRDG